MELNKLIPAEFKVGQHIKLFTIDGKTETIYEFIYIDNNKFILISLPKSPLLPNEVLKSINSQWNIDEFIDFEVCRNNNTVTQGKNLSIYKTGRVKKIQLINPHFPEDIDNLNKKKSNKIIVSVVIFLILILAIAYFFVIRPILEKTNRETAYIVADTVTLYNTPTNSIDNNKIGKLCYGNEIQIINKKDEWLYVYSNDLQLKGYIQTQYVLNKTRFLELNEIFYNKKAYKQIRSQNNIEVLINYFKRNDFNNKEKWYFRASAEGTGLHTSCIVDLTENKKDEFICMISNQDKSEYRLFIYSFDNDGKPKLIYEEEIRTSLTNILKIEKGSHKQKWNIKNFFYNSKKYEYLPTDGFSIKFSEYQEYVYYYNGKTITKELVNEKEIIASSKFIIVDKETLTLFLYSYNGSLLSKYDITVGVNYGDKQKGGDNKTPEGVFNIISIEDASGWFWDFKNDNLGPIKAFGNYFMRLKTPVNNSVGIHGSHDTISIKKRASHGCIRMRNEDLDDLRSQIRVGTVVAILPSAHDIFANKDTLNIIDEMIAKQYDYGN